MLSAVLGDRGRPLRVLAVGCHADDIEIGCAGALLRLARRAGGAELHWVVLATAEPVRAAEATESAARFLPEGPRPDVRLGGFRDGFMPYQGAEVKEFFEGLKAIGPPDLVLTHQRHDLHQDHRLACELCWNTFRDAVILEYEIPKWDGDMGAPNLFVPLDEETVERKVRHLMESFASQRSKRWFTEDLFRGLMRIRGMECNSPSGFAEGFYARKLPLDVAPGT